VSLPKPLEDISISTRNVLMDLVIASISLLVMMALVCTIWLHMIGNITKAMKLEMRMELTIIFLGIVAWKEKPMQKTSIR
jgi:hypothetical protein